MADIRVVYTYRLAGHGVFHAMRKGHVFAAMQRKFLNPSEGYCWIVHPYGILEDHKFVGKTRYHAIMKMVKTLHLYID